MRKHLLRYYLNIEYVVAALVVLVLVRTLYLISDNLPEADETSFLDPIFGRIDFLNIKDVSLDAIFAMKDKSFPDKRIVVVNLGEMGPVPDGKIALVLYKLHDWGARVIAIDAFFDDKHFERFPKDRAFEVDALKQALREVPGVVLVNGYEEESLTPSIDIDPEIRRSVTHYGYANLTSDDDGVVRRFFPYRTIDSSRWLAFPMKVVEQYDSTMIAPLLSLREEPQVIYYSGTVDEMQPVSIDEILSDDTYASFFKDKIVLIGLVRERGLVYLGDMHKTPMGRRTVAPQQDGSSRMGMEGPDMPGLLIHANVVNMLLKREFITPVPAWIDWTLAFVLSYISIALYRVLRTKPRTKLGLGYLISAFIIVETIVVFFLPIISFFYLDIKISYHLMATAVLMFIPAQAWTTKMRHRRLHRQTRRRFEETAAHVIAPLKHAFRDDEAFTSYHSTLHASLTFLHYAFAIEASRRRASDSTIDIALRFPRLEQWRAYVPSIDAVFTSADRVDAHHTLFYSYLDGKKPHYLRDAAVKNEFLSTQYDHFNEHMFFEEWDAIIPHVMRLFAEDLRAYHRFRLFAIETLASGQRRAVSIGTGAATRRIDFASLVDGIHAVDESDGTITALDPLCLFTECKLHRERELFVYAGIIRKQFSSPPMPAYYGRTISCEPVLDGKSIGQFADSVSQPFITDPL